MKSREKLCIFQVSLSELNLKIISKNLKLASQVATVFCSSRLSCSCGSSSSTLSGKGNTGDNQGSMQRRNSCSQRPRHWPLRQKHWDKGMGYDFGRMIVSGSVAQLAERALRMREAPGSKPGVSTSFWPANKKVSAQIFACSDCNNIKYTQAKVSARCGGRTHDHKVKSLALCQLS